MVQTASYDPVVVDLELTPAKVEELIRRGYESAKLDYKSEIDHTSRISRLRLVKHILAMANTAGGYIVVGVGDDGELRGLSAEAAGYLDEANVRSLVRGFTSVPIALASHNALTVDGRLFAIVAVLPLQDRIAVAESDAQCEEGGRSTFVFRKGDVLVRHGTASERWNQTDADYLIGRARLAQKQAWLQEFARDYMAVASLVQNLTPPIVDPSVFTLAPDEFQQLVLRLLRSQ